MQGTVPGTCTPVDSARHDKGVEVFVRSMNWELTPRMTAATAMRASCNIAMQTRGFRGTASRCWAVLKDAGDDAETARRAGEWETCLEALVGAHGPIVITVVVDNNSHRNKPVATNQIAFGFKLGAIGQDHLPTIFSSCPPVSNARGSFATQPQGTPSICV